MKISVSDILGGKSTDIPFEENLSIDMSSVGVDSVQAFVKGKLFRKNNEVYVQSFYNAILLKPCDRCLVQTKEILKGELSTQLCDSRGNAPEENVHLLEKNMFLLNCFFEEEILLAMSGQTLCKQDCKGLCPTCGTDLNEMECNCEKKGIDPRLETLKNFFNK